MLIKRQDRQARRGTLAASLASQAGGTLDRRAFLRRSGLAVGGLAVVGALPMTGVRKAEAGPPPAQGAAVTIRKNICTHCSVGCTVIAEVQNGVWIGQEPGWDIADQPRHRIAPRALRCASWCMATAGFVPDEAGQRRVDPRLLGLRRSTRSATR